MGSDDKARLAKEHGCTHVIDDRTEDYVPRVREITKGCGCDVVYDVLGKDTFPSSLDCLKPKGMWVSFGSSSVLVLLFEIAPLSVKGLLDATRPTLDDLHRLPRPSAPNAADLQTAWQGAGKIAADDTYPLREAASA